MFQMRLILTLVFLSLTLGCATGGSSSKFEIRSYKEAKLKNGLRVLFVEDRSLPSISFLMLVKTGSSADPEGQSGLTSLVTSLLDKGSSKRSTLQIADSLGQYGGSFGASVSHDFAMASASALSFHEDQLLTDFVEIVTEPAFSQNEVNRMKQQTVARLKKIVDDPSDFAGVMFEDYLFSGHPYSKNPAGTAKDLSKISRKHIIRHYLQNFRPNNAMLAVVGNYSPKILDKLNQKFSQWEARDLEPQAEVNIAKSAGLKVRILDKADLKQSQVRIGHIGIRRSEPDFLALRLANTILGGAFSSRLVHEIREKRGLTYSIGSYFDARKLEGPFIISTFTRNDKVGETVKESIRILKEFKDKGVTEDEVRDAKAYLRGTFPRSLETPEALAQNLLYLRFYGVPDSYLTNYLRDIERLSASAVNKAIAKHFKPENLSILVYSPRAGASAQLKDLGALEIKSFKEFLQ